MTIEFVNAIRDTGLQPPDYIQPGIFHHFPGVDKKPSNKAGWCILFEDCEGGMYGDFATDFRETWHVKRENPLTPKEKKQWRKNIAQANVQAKAEEKKHHAEAAEKAVEIWRNAKPAPADHKYLIRKSIKAHGARLNSENLALPLFSGDKICSIQFISPTGSKWYLSGGRVKGCSYSIGTPSDIVLIAEGFATAASLHEATGHAVEIAFTAGNLRAVSLALREKLPDARIIVCADNDTKTDGNPGKTKATEAAIAIGGLMAIPPEHGDFNDLERSHGAEAVNKCIQSALLGESDQRLLVEVSEITGLPDLTHDALALNVSHSGWTEIARYVHKWGKWIFWGGQRWKLDEQLLHKTKIRQLLQGMGSELLRNAGSASGNSDGHEIPKSVLISAKNLRDSTTIHSVETLARSNADLVARPDQFDSDPMLIGTPQGTVSLITGNLLKAEPKQWITKFLATTPAEAGTLAPRWQSFLDRVFNGNKELISFMQRAAGYALTGHTREHKLFFLYGTGRNGKSVFLDTIYQIMGDYSTRSASNTFLDNKHESHPTGLAGLMGARLVAGSELPAGKAWNESVIKDLTGGDVISARFMRQDYFDYMPQFTLFIAGNHQPAFRGIDEAIRARVALVPFTETIPESERDSKLSEKLKQEWPAILRWMIDGAVEWNRNGLQVPDVIKAASEEYLDAEDALGEFLNEHVETLAKGKVTTAAMYDRFVDWQDRNGMRHTWSKPAMSKALRERGFEYAKLTNGVRGFKGIALKTAGQYLNKRTDG